MEGPPLSSTRSAKFVARLLSEAFLDGTWEIEDLVERGSRVLGRRWRWLRSLARRVRDRFAAGPRPRAARVVAFLLGDPHFLGACRRHAVGLGGTLWLPPVMSPAPGPPSSWAVPGIATTAALAERLGLAPSELDWFAGRRRRDRASAEGPLGHYDYRWQAKASGASRLIEAPRPRLKALQRRVLDEILGLIPPHDAAHGFRPGRSVRSYVDPHVGRPVVLKMDLRDFFPTISSARVAAVFLTAGYPEPVAVALAGLCTNGVPDGVWEDRACPVVSGPERWRIRQLFRQRHLPQGAPTSPALANLCAYRLDCRLDGLARSAGARYTRYADDLAFSGDFELARSARRFHIRACAIALEEGFAVQPHKTRVMPQGVRQRVAGVVLNERPNVPRPEYDALKATLHNCLRHGPGGQNRAGHEDFRAHLAGRVGYVESLNPHRGRRLRALFDGIAW